MLSAERPCNVPNLFNIFNIFQRNEWIASLTMTKERWYHASCLLGENKIWISGGRRNGRSSSEYLQLGQNSFKPFVDLPEGMHSHVMIRINESAVLFLGNYPQSKNVYMFDVDLGRFERLPPLKIARTKPFAGVYQLLIGNLKHIDCYFHLAGLVTYTNGLKKVVVAGGWGGQNIQSTEILNLETLEWESGPDLPNVMASSGESVPFRNSFLIVGGYKGKNYLDMIYEFDLDTDNWKLKPQRLKKGRLFFTAFLIPDDIAGC